jgi:hypothetical protein
MIANPCDSVLTPGIYGSSEGLLARLKKTVFNSTNNTAGYILWAPEYHCAFSDQDEKPGDATPYNCGNLFLWASDSADQQPFNDKEDNLGEMAYGSQQSQTFVPATAKSSAFTADDPARSFLDSDLVQDARTISACIRMKYTGQMYHASGEIAFIEDLPIQSLLYGADGSEAASVNQLFQQANHTARLGAHNAEIVARPDEHADTFRDDRATPIDVAISDREAGLPSQRSQSSVSQDGKIRSPSVFGFAWRGIDLGTANSVNLAFDLVKNIEWRPEPVSGLTHATPVQLSPIPLTQSAVAYLDEHHPGWTTRLFQGLGTAARLALAGGSMALRGAAFAGGAARMGLLPLPSPQLLLR